MKNRKDLLGYYGAVMFIIGAAILFVRGAAWLIGNLGVDGAAIVVLFLGVLMMLLAGEA